MRYYARFKIDGNRSAHFKPMHCACGKSYNTQDPCRETPGTSGHLGSENTVVHSLLQCSVIFYHFLAPKVASKEQKEEEILENMPKVVYWSQHSIHFFFLDDVIAFGYF